MNIGYAQTDDLDLLAEFDSHVSREELADIISRQRVIVMENDEGVMTGWLRYGLFWDNTPFMNLLYVKEEERGKGYGRQLVDFWEREMAAKGYSRLITSTQSDEQAQHFYRKLGYADCGEFILPGESPEIIMIKEI